MPTQTTRPCRAAVSFVALLALCAMTTRTSATRRQETASMETPTPRASGRVSSADAVVRWTPRSITLETSRVQVVLATDGGRLVRTRWLDRQTGRDQIAGHPEADFHVFLDQDMASSSQEGWTVAPPVVRRGKSRELVAEVRCTRDGLDVRRFLTVYPGLSLVRERTEVRADHPVTLVDPGMGRSVLRAKDADLLWMTGAEPFGDSWQLKREHLPPGSRAFDSYDAPPSPAATTDGVDGRILLGDRQVFPATGWAHSGHAGDPAAHGISLEVQAGDRLLFVLSRHGNMSCDTTDWDPVVAYDDGTRYQASAGFADKQGTNQWRYGYLSDDGHWEDMVYDPAPGRYGKRWRRRIGVTEPFVAATEMHPDPQGCAVRVFVAPRAGKVRVTGRFVNTGNTAPAGRGPRMGTQTHAPWFCFQDRETEQALYVGFDCIAHWQAFATTSGEQAVLESRLAGFRKELTPGDVVRTPTMFTGLFHGDLDEMGQELAEWQYRYMWDYTRTPWFPGVRLLGYWYKGTKWNTAFASTYNDPEAAYRKAFRTAELMRQVGGDTYHRDWGWWDKAGDWNGPDFRAANDYLRQYGMALLIYAHMYNIEGDSSVAKEHPPWLIGGGVLDQSIPQVVDYEANLLGSFYERFGPYQFRNDGQVIAPRDGNDTSLLAQQQGFFEVIRRFLDAHPDCGMHGVNGGGFALNWEYLRLTSGFQFTDGQAVDIADYFASYLFPVDKINNMPDIWDPEKYDQATWRGLLCSNIDFTGDTFDPVKLEGIRQILDIYHFLEAHGVVGRWVRAYHPQVEGDDARMVLQRLSWDRKRGCIITKRLLKGPVVVRPKGLLPGETYHVSFQEQPGTLQATGAQLMRDGVRLAKPAPGELIYLNLPGHPGNHADRTPPQPPTGVTCREERWMGVPGVGVRWKPGHDETWLSGYKVYRDGKPLDLVAKGCFYFDHSAGADPAAIYAVRSVDGSGNESDLATSKAPARPVARRLVLDDADAGIAYVGDWRHQAFAPAHAGTLTSADAAGAAFAVEMTGKAVVWHSRLGAEGGLARVTVDDEAPVTVSCFGADEIPCWPLFEKRWSSAGRHTLRVEVLGQPDPRSKGTRVWLDGVTVEP